MRCVVCLFTKLYCFLTEAPDCEQLARRWCYGAVRGGGSDTRICYTVISTDVCISNRKHERPRPGQANFVNYDLGLKYTRLSPAPYYRVPQPIEGELAEYYSTSSVNAAP